MTATWLPGLADLDTLPALGNERLLLMALLAVLGSFLFFGGSRIGGWMAGQRADPVAVSKILRFAGAILLLSALAVRPYNPETAVFPPPPDAAGRAALPD